MTRFGALLALALLLVLPAHAQAPDFTALVRDVAGAVVNLSGSPRPMLPDLPLAEDEEADDRRDLWRHFGPPPELRRLGSGFVIDESGYIIANAHLVQNAEQQEIVVRLADRREFEARVVGFDPVSDIALLKIEDDEVVALLARHGKRTTPA